MNTSIISMFHVFSRLIVVTLFTLVITLCSEQVFAQRAQKLTSDGSILITIINSDRVLIGEGSVAYKFIVNAQQFFDNREYTDVLTNVIFTTNYGVIEFTNPRSITLENPFSEGVLNVTETITNQDLTIKKVEGLINGKLYDLTAVVHGSDYTPLPFVQKQ